MANLISWCLSILTWPFAVICQYYIFVYVDAPAYQILKNLNIISTGVLYRIILKKKLVSFEQLEIIFTDLLYSKSGTPRIMVTIYFVDYCLTWIEAESEFQVF